MPTNGTISVTDMNEKASKKAKPTPKDKETADLLMRLWREYQDRQLEQTGRRPKQAAIIEGTGLSQSTVSQYMNGHLKFGYGAVLRFAAFFGVPPTSIRDDLEALPREPADEGWEDVTAYSQAVGLGGGAEAQEYAETNALKFKASSLRKRGIYGRPLAVYYGKGDSMEPTIKNGDAIMFDTSDTRPIDGLLYVVQVGREILVKRAEILDGTVYFRSDNPHGDHAWRKARRMDSKKEPIQILGRVHWIAGWAD